MQDSRKLLEGCFISFAAALHFAQSERHLYHAVVEVSVAPLSPRIAYRPVDAHVHARAA
ncbi:hypothetical protein [Sphingomonas morindae]|uniref:Uncharacterized protein n=1 Tax=Sphingomonas morindae TaxID=1541170 RepID=A0ABY4X6I3_9SPHN|nr:hypothetical protein [Sphingomonas morindae]USI72489.1 hypothetical protein LHA26_14515 [Sphingomonas morindae]